MRCTPGENIYALAIKQDGLSVIGGNQNGALVFWQIEGEQCLERLHDIHNSTYYCHNGFNKRTGAILSLCLNHSQAYVITLGADQQIAVVDLASRSVFHRFTGVVASVQRSNYSSLSSTLK